MKKTEQNHAQEALLPAGEQECLRRNRARIRFFVIAACVLILGVGLTVTYFFTNLLNGLKVDPGTRPSGYTAPSEPPETPDPDFPAVLDISDAADLNGFLYEWWHNGGDEKIMYSKDVLNVLLLGVDADDGVPGTGRSDTMMLASINKKTKAITLLSFLRDSYCYLDVNGDEYYDRLNTAYHNGGAAALMNAIAHLYKIRVDRYASVDFNSYPKLIDALGGVKVDVTEQEAAFINRNAPTMHHSFPAGDGVTLTGKQALIFSRIRYLDSEENRTKRQQRVIASIIESAKGATTGQIYNALDQTLPYVTTNFSYSEIIGYIPRVNTWMTYAMQNLHTPLLDGPEANAVGTYITGRAVWVVDYPVAAREVQLALYGKSNIDVTEGGDRGAYIARLFAEAEDKTRSYAERPATAAPGVTDAGTDAPRPSSAAGEPTTGQGGSIWDLLRPTRPPETEAPPPPLPEESVPAEPSSGD
ncbi:MAG: LCP family protein [Oscillospiraceae bacterium]|jgi:LCP family protein required for cell wall assembly|nr:LCP family protein [Oscillospiraceae bacterium]